MNKQPGFTLIEVLVALVVLSIGLLGIAALQIEGVRAGYSALQRSQAVNLASDMADRIRANPNGDYAVGAGPATATPPGTICADTADAEAPGDCTPAAMATYDIWEWRNAISSSAATGLPGGQGQIDRDTTTTPASMVVTVSWTDKEQARSYRLTVQQ